MKNVKRKPLSWFTRAAKAASRAAGWPATLEDLKRGSVDAGVPKL